MSGEVDEFFQYRINMSSTNTEDSPIVERFGLSWDSQGISDQGDEHYVFCQNPSLGSIRVNQSDNRTNHPLTIQVYSTSGRLVETGSIENQESFVSGRLSPGVYLIRAEYDGRVLENKTIILLH